jgi:hypothetical protein
MTVAAPVSSAPVGQRTNTPAIVALITGILGINVVAIALGHIALVQIKRSGERGKVLAIVGLVLGYLGLLAVIIAAVALVSYVQSGPVIDTTFP